ncbi:MBL fold metallo-hydrolase [Streptomyces sp. NPDC004237]|uniref:MBL fold metallo-hydrolase n=1 Tax=Streptomyces sp. NPDC004237 TaxID=3154455 RepID=UPI00339E0D73
MKIGTITIDGLIDGDFRIDPATAYPAVAAERWAPYRDFLDAAGRVEFTVGGFLVRDGRNNILVDLGVGPEPPEPYTGGALLDALRGKGLEAGDIDHVVFTHLHYDHTGWVTRNGSATFENAIHHVHEADWVHFYSADYPGLRMEREHDLPLVRFAPVADRVRLWTDAAEIAPAVRLRHVPGHTPGTTVVEIVSGGERGLLIGDVAHSPVELLEDGWPGVGDVDGAAARRSAAAVAAELVAEGVPFALAHMPGLSWTRLESVDGLRRLVVLDD